MGFLGEAYILHSSIAAFIETSKSNVLSLNAETSIRHLEALT